MQTSYELQYDYYGDAIFPRLQYRYAPGPLNWRIGGLLASAVDARRRDSKR